MAEQIQNKDSYCQQVLAAIFGHACTDKHPGMTSEEELTAHVTPWANQFRDDIAVLKEFDAGDCCVNFGET